MSSLSCYSVPAVSSISCCSVSDSITETTSHMHVANAMLSLQVGCPAPHNAARRTAPCQAAIHLSHMRKRNHTRAPAADLCCANFSPRARSAPAVIANSRYLNNSTAPLAPDFSSGTGSTNTSASPSPTTGGEYLPAGGISKMSPPGLAAPPRKG
jgi:hypothetical protein